MALARLELKTVRRSCGRSMPVSAAYRAGMRLTDRRTGTVADYRRRTGVVAQALYSPMGEADPAIREAVWNSAELAERRRDAVVGREMIIALPHELPADRRVALARDFASLLAREEVVFVDVTVHEPSQHGDARNTHAHLLFSSRTATANDRSGIGFGPKTTVWDNKHTGGARLKAWRERFEVLTNAHLSWAGSSARIDMRSLRDQGLDRIPGRHDGPSVTQDRRRLSAIRTRITRAQERLSDLIMTGRVGADAGLIASMAASLRAVLTVSHFGTAHVEGSAPTPVHSPVLDR